MIKQVKKIELKYQNSKKPRNVKLASLAAVAGGSYAQSNKKTKLVGKKNLMGNLEDYMLRDFPPRSESSQKIHTKIFRDIEKNSKIYEDELLKFLGNDLVKIKQNPSKSFNRIQNNLKVNSQKIATVNKSWSQQLKKIEAEEENIKKSLKSLEEKHFQQKKKFSNPVFKKSKLNHELDSSKKLKVISKFILRKINKK
jgi:hypothetical protein